MILFKHEIDISFMEELHEYSFPDTSKYRLWLRFLNVTISKEGQTGLFRGCVNFCLLTFPIGSRRISP